MRLLDRYQLRELLLALLYCLLGILVFWMAFELLGEMDELKRRNIGPWETLAYLGHRLPLFLLIQIPVALLLSLLYALSQHARHHELVAMRAAGISPWRISLPYLGVGIVLSGGMLALNEYVVPDAAARADAVLERATAGAPDRAWKLGLNFRDPQTDRSWYVQAFNVQTAELRGVHVVWKAEGGGREELMATRGIWEGDGWLFERVTRFSFGPDRSGIETVPIRHESLKVTDFPETPAHLRSEVKISQLLGSVKKSRQVQLSLREIHAYRELHPSLTPKAEAQLETWFHDRLATPWMCLVVVLIGLPAATGSGRRNPFVGVAAAIFLAFAFFVVKEFSLAAGAGGYVAPWLAAWLPNLVFGGSGVVAMQRTR
ncbi:MAG: LptF/LptG family permease [Verrucomicrobiales bacterium]|nr:LptF/LptG family permease [Verrucomicrobiales bacterium]